MVTMGNWHSYKRLEKRQLCGHDE